MNKSIGVIAGLAAAGVIKTLTGGSTNNKGYPDCTGMTGDPAFDIFEGPFPKIWHSMALDDLVHPRIKGDNKLLVKSMHRYIRNAVYSTLGAGLSFRETVTLPTSTDSLNKVMDYFLNKRKMSVDQATESAIRVANNITLLMSDDQTKQGFMDMWYWLKHGSNIAVVGPNMQAIFENTSLANIRMDDISMPFNTIYIALGL